MMMINAPTADTTSTDEPPRDSAAAPLSTGETATSAAHESSSVLDSPHERAYGTFEVSVIDVESDSEQPPPLRPVKSTDFDAEEEHARASCLSDCCAFVSLLWLPFRVQTYKIVVFHFVSALFALGAAVATVLFYVIKLLLTPVLLLVPRLCGVEAAMLRVLLHADAALFNFVCPRAERIRVYNSSTANTAGGSQVSYSAQIYFAVAKLMCGALPGLVASVALLWTIRNFVIVLLAGVATTAGTTTVADPMAPIENDVLILLSLIAVYVAAALTKVFADISRHVTIFFCAEYLLYASPL